MMDKNQYKIETKLSNGEVVHNYFTGEIEEIKNILRGQNLNSEQYRKFKATIKGILRITREIDSIASEHSARLNKSKGHLYSLETKLTLGDICSGGEDD